MEKPAVLNIIVRSRYAYQLGADLVPPRMLMLQSTKSAWLSVTAVMGNGLRRKHSDHIGVQLVMAFRRQSSRSEIHGVVYARTTRARSIHSD